MGKVDWLRLSPNVTAWLSPAGRVVVNGDVYGPNVYLDGRLVWSRACPAGGWPDRTPAHLMTQAREWAEQEYLDLDTYDYQI